MRAAAIQLNSTGDIDRNLARADDLTRAAAADGAEPLRDLIAALHQKLLVAELKRQRDARG